MFDIGFYMAQHAMADPSFKRLEQLRDTRPFVYNIETTNACNMKCRMCPRTTMMTRPVEFMKPELFESIALQIMPHDAALWLRWQRFVLQIYGIREDDMSENHFFCYIIPQVVQLHGYGEPLLDKNLPRYITLLTELKLQSYFSCNPANIDVDRLLLLFQCGLGYIKFSVESVDEQKHQQIRGKQPELDKLITLLELKEQYKLKTKVIITMLDLQPDQRLEYDKLVRRFKDYDVYVYLKSQDQQWYEQKAVGTKSIHWSEPCKHAWMSMTIKSDGKAAMCMEDFNNEIILGDTASQSLSDIWNGKLYKQFRQDIFTHNSALKCITQCDMPLYGGC